MGTRESVLETRRDEAEKQNSTEIREAEIIA